MLLNLNSKDYLYLQVYEKIKNKILNGQLKFDEKLPSIRNLAHENKISYNTVTNAYVLLEEEGYIYSKGRSGFFVSKKKDFLKLEKIKPINNDINAKLDFSFSGVDLNFPFYNWKKSFNKAIDQFNLEFLKKSDPKGDIHLRKSISNYLKKARNIDANYENIIISAGINHLFYIIKNILGEQVKYAFEDPGYCWGREYFDSNNRSNFSLNIDSEGASIENVINGKNIALLLTPAHQFPLGIIMSKKRKKEILNWLKEDDTRYLIEDDYDGEFNFSNTRFIPLYKNDENIIYIGSFSRSITPALRISYMIIPDGLLKKYDQIFNGFECPCSLFTQKALGVFIEDGYFERHVNRMRNLYTKKKEIIEKKLSNNNHIKIINDINGLVALIDINLNDKKQFENRLLKEKIKLTSINRFQKRSENSDYYILDYSKIEINRLNDAIDTLIEIVKELE